MPNIKSIKTSIVSWWNRKPPKGVVVIGYTVAIFIGIYLAYLFVEFLNNYINLTHPTGPERVLMISGCIGLSALAYYSFRKIANAKH